MRPVEKCNAESSGFSLPFQEKLKFKYFYLGIIFMIYLGVGPVIKLLYHGLVKLCYV